MTRNQRILLIGLGVILILLAYNYLIYQPRQATFTRLSAELKSRQAERDRLQGIAARREALEREYTEAQSVVAIVEAKLPAEKDVPTLLVQLETLVTSLKVDLATMSPGPLQAPQAPRGAPPAGGAQPAAPQATRVYSTMPIQLGITATFKQLVELMTALQDFPRLLAVKTISVGPSTLPKLNVGLTAETYVLPKGAR